MGGGRFADSGLPARCLRFSLNTTGSSFSVTTAPRSGTNSRCSRSSHVPTTVRRDSASWRWWSRAIRDRHPRERCRDLPARRGLSPFARDARASGRCDAARGVLDGNVDFGLDWFEIADQQIRRARSLRHRRETASDRFARPVRTRSNSTQGELSPTLASSSTRRGCELTATNGVFGRCSSGGWPSGCRRPSRRSRRSGWCVLPCVWRT